jgi:hypothetical protein
MDLTHHIVCSRAAASDANGLIGGPIQIDQIAAFKVF